MKACIYARYSSLNQQETSIDEQIERCSEYAKAHDMEIVETYIDRAKSAHVDIEKRTEFLRMINDSKGYDFVIVYKLDRFSRNDYDAAFYKNELRKNSCRLVSATENIPDSPEGKLMEGFIQTMSTYYSDVLSVRVSAGMRQNAKRHRVLGIVPHGYMNVDGQYAINEDEAEAVRLAYSLYAGGSRICEILDALDAKGLRTRKGTPFTKTSFYSMFSNERYIGTYIHGDYREEDAIPAIVDRETYAKVQRRLATECDIKTRKGRMKFDYLLSGKLFCQCGARIVGKSARSKYVYYSCEKCHQSWNAQEVEDRVARIMRSLFTDELMAEIAQGIVDALRNDDIDRVIERLKSERELDERRVARIRRIMMDSDDGYELFKDELKPLQNRISELTLRISEEESRRIVLSYDEVYAFLEKYRDSDFENHEARKGIVNILLHKAVMYSDSLDLYVNLDEKEKSNTEVLHEFRMVELFGPHATVHLLI